MNNLTQPLFLSIKEKNKLLILDIVSKLPIEESILNNLTELMLFVNQSAKGEQHDLLNKFIKQICAKTIKKI